MNRDKVKRKIFKIGEILQDIFVMLVLFFLEVIGVLIQWATVLGFGLVWAIAVIWNELFNDD